MYLYDFGEKNTGQSKKWPYKFIKDDIYKTSSHYLIQEALLVT